MPLDAMPSLQGCDGYPLKHLNTVLMSGDEQ